jgi:hypothetical protein
MKKLFLLLLITIGFGASAQTFGSASINVEGSFNATQPVYRKWLTLPNKNNVVMKYELTEKGLNDAIEAANKLLLQNQLDPGNPDIISTVINDGNRDNIPSLYKSVIAGKSKINEAWNLPEGSTLHLFISKDSFEINILKAYGKKN